MILIITASVFAFIVWCILATNKKPTPKKENIMKYTLPPHDEAAEREVLGNILLDNKLMNDLPKDISKYFFNKQNADICKSMILLKNANAPIDLISVGNDSKLPHITEYLAGMVDNVEPAEFPKAVKSISDNYLRREVVQKASGIITDAYNVNIPVKELLASVLGIIASLLRRSN